MYSVLVVDDETLIRRSIIAKLEKSQIGFKAVLEARNANDALQYTDIDILITDIRMGSPSGLELARRMKERSPFLKAIIISGYSEFSYATEALSIGVIDYLVKPINTEGLLESVRKAIGILDREAAERRSRDKATIEESSANLAALFHGESPLSPDVLAPYLSCRNCSGYLSVRLFVPKPTENILYVVMHGIQASSFALGYDIATYKDKLRQVGMLLALPKGADPLRTVSPLVESIANLLTEKGMDLYTFGVSDRSSDPSLCYEQSLDAVRHRIVFPSSHLVLHADCTAIDESFVFGKEDRTKLLLLLESQDIGALHRFMERLADEIVKHLPVTYHSLSLLSNYITDAISGSLGVCPPAVSASREPYEFDSVRDLVGYLEGLCVRAIGNASVATNKSRTFDLVRKLQHFIEHHYDRPFTLELFCSENNINTSFFSSQFHQVTGVRFQEYLTNTRIENAKRLLADPDNRIGTVASLCGFSDQHYFSKTFKRMTGLTPREFQLRAREADAP